MLLIQAPPMVQTQPTFYAAWEDALDEERQQHWTAALQAYRRALTLRPRSAALVVIYGNNVLRDYHPYTRMARCHLELGELAKTEAMLSKATTEGEPAAERESLAQRLREQKQARLPGPPPALSAPVSVPEIPAPTPPSAHPTLSLENHTAPQERPPEPPPSAPATPQPSHAPLEKARPPQTPSPSPPSEPEPVRTAPQEGRPAWQSLAVLFASVGALSYLAYWFLRKSQAQARPGPDQPLKVGPYVVERLLGRGGFASTYLAHHRLTGRAVALKLLHPYRQDDPEFLGRFRQEAHLGLLLDHPNLVRLVDTGPEVGPPWLAMEYIEGPRLDAILSERGPLPVQEAVAMATSVASAMAHAHGHGIVHRDLKPANVILCEGQLMVMDFGIARILDSDTLTTTYAFLGTPLYAAPEAQFKNRVGPAADSYSMGIMLFEMLTGAVPFRGETPFETLELHRSAPLPDLAALRPGLPPALVQFVEHLCAKKPEDRPGDDEIMETLQTLGWEGGIIVSGSDI